MTTDELIALMQSGSVIRRESYFNSERDCDSWIMLDGVELEYGNPEDEKILSAIAGAAKEGVVDFFGWQEGLLNQTETLAILK